MVRSFPMNDLANQFENLIIKSTPLINNYIIPKNKTKLFSDFKESYKYDKKWFFKHIKNIEIPVLNSYKSLVQKNNFAIKNKNYLSNSEIEKFLSGGILKKTVNDIDSLNILKGELHNLIEQKNAPFISNKLLYFFTPSVINFIIKNKHSILGAVNSLLGQSEDISFELGYFKTIPGYCNQNWHDDYTLFRNKVPEQEQMQSLILNIHLALSDVKKESSPLTFLLGTDKLVYARAAIKYFHQNHIKFDEELFLKATYLTEELYIPGKKIKPNFLGPCYSYRLFQLNVLKKVFNTLYHEVKYGDFLIFSPHYMHSSPSINTESSPRESLVFRFLSDNYFNFRNISTVKELGKYLSFAQKNKLSFEYIRNKLFYNYPNVTPDSQIYLSIYLNKKSCDYKYDSYLKIYLEDLFIFFNNS